MKVEVTIYMPEELRTALRVEAATRGITLSSLVEDALRRVLYRPERASTSHPGRSRERKNTHVRRPKTRS